MYFGINNEISARLGRGFDGRYNVSNMQPTMHEKDGKHVITNGFGQPIVNATGVLPYKTWEILSDSITKAMRQRVTAFRSIMDAGLIVNPGSAWNGTIYIDQFESDEGASYDSMTGESGKQYSEARFSTRSVPMPFNIYDFKIFKRNMMSAESGAFGGGSSYNVDVSQVDKGTRRILEHQEDMLLGIKDGAANTTPYEFGGGYVYGYLNHPSKISKTLTATWLTATGAQVNADVLDMVSKANAVNAFGNFELVMGTAYGNALNRPMSEYHTQTIYNNLLDINVIDSIVIADRLPANTVILVQKTMETVQIIDAMGISPIMWDSMGDGAVHYMKLMACQIPNVRADFNGNCGVVVGTP